MDKLYIIIPAYNEEMNIVTVATQWHEVVQHTNAESRLIILDDGSTDNTYNILKALVCDLPQMIPITKPNAGHGATILYGYHYALDNNANYIFQTDSDGQTSPAEFTQFWNLRTKYSILIGFRNHRQDGVSRIFVTNILKLLLWCIFHVFVTDANSPFRLMEREVLKKYIHRLPIDFHLPNVILTLLFVKYEESIHFIPITFKPRQGGVNSNNLIKIIKIGKQALKDFLQIKNSLS